MILHKSLPDINNISYEEIEYLVNLIDEKQISVNRLTEINSACHLFSKMIYDLKTEENINFNYLTSLQFKLILTYISNINSLEKKKLLLGDLHSQIKNNPTISTKLKYIKIERYWTLTTLQYDSFEKNYHNFICVKRRDIRLSSLYEADRWGCIYQCYIAKYENGFGNKYYYYPYQCDKRWKSAFASVTNKNELDNFRKAIAYDQMFSIYLCINSFQLDSDVAKYIKILFYQDFDLKLLSGIIIK